MAYEHVFSMFLPLVRRRVTVALASLLVLGSGEALAQDRANIAVIGAIASGSCNISTTPVHLGEHRPDFFNGGVGTPTSWVNVDITSQGCSADIVTLHMGFDGIADANDNGLFAIAPGGARGIGIQMQTRDGSITVVPNSTTNLVNWNPLPTGGIYPMRARYVSTSPSVIPGAADSTVTVMLSYN